MQQIWDKDQSDNIKQKYTTTKKNIKQIDKNSGKL